MSTATRGVIVFLLAVAGLGCASTKRPTTSKKTDGAVIIMPEWKNCHSEYENGVGLMISCAGAAVVQIIDGDDDDIPLDAYADHIEETVETPLTRTRRDFALGGRRWPGLALSPKDGRDLRGLIAVVVLPSGARRRMECIAARPNHLGMCEEIFAHFASGTDLAAYQTKKAPEPWGREYADTATDSRLKDLVGTFGRQPESVGRFFKEGLVVGPGLYHWLNTRDAKFEKIAKPAMLLSVDPPVPMGSYSGDEVRDFLRAPVVDRLFRNVAGGTVRAATIEERRLFYSEIPYEIERHPISVVERGQLTLVVDFDPDGVVVWMELFHDDEREPVPEVP